MGIKDYFLRKAVELQNARDLQREKMEDKTYTKEMRIVSSWIAVIGFVLAIAGVLVFTKSEGFPGEEKVDLPIYVEGPVTIAAYAVTCFITALTAMIITLELFYRFKNRSFLFWSAVIIISAGIAIAGLGISEKVVGVVTIDILFAGVFLLSSLYSKMTWKETQEKADMSVGEKTEEKT